MYILIHVHMNGVPGPIFLDLIRSASFDAVCSFCRGSISDESKFIVQPNTAINAYLY